MTTSERDYLYGQEHVERYRATEGEEGHIWRRGTTILLLTTRGRRSGEPRTMPLIYREVDGGHVIVASNDGESTHPGWYLNMQQHPGVEVQVKGEVFRARARDARGEQRDRLWRLMVEVWPDYERYQSRTDRQLPVVVLERQE